MAETAGSTVKFAVGTLVVTKGLEILGNKLHAKVSEHVTSRAKTFTEKHGLLTGRKKYVLGTLAIVGIGVAWYYYKKHQMQKKAIADAAAALAAKKEFAVKEVETQDIIASVIPDVTLWG